MAKKEQDHRHRRELSPYQLSKRGQTLGLIALVFILAFCGWLAHEGGTTVAGVVASLDVVGIVTVFVVGAVTRRPDDETED